MGTSSSSSSSYSSSSSSSGFFCAFPDCTGNACTNFPSWVLSGVTSSLVTDGKLYALFNYFGGTTQQVEIYNDPNYFNLIAIGQGTSSPIVLEERNDSGVSGVVTWTGTPVYYTTPATLYCGELSSSSSSSSYDSSSSSSCSNSSASSSSSACCTNPYCDGQYCSEFGSWTFSGMNDRNSNNCKLYVGLEADAITGVQQVRIYKDSSYTNLVAIGQTNVAGVITLNQVDASGLSGSVIWYGTLIYYPNTLLLDCQKFSSSSSTSSSSYDSSSSSSYDSSSTSTSSTSTSSSSSIDSSSSSSSTSYGVSSSSTSSHSSKSSLSSSSSSSSSSIDSSSTSSESIGNISSSSSSSVVLWNRLKPLALALVANAQGLAHNRLAQTIKIETITYSIGSVYCYLFGPYGANPNFTIYLAIYDCYDNGKPNNLIAVRTLSHADIIGEKWYEFDFSINGTISSNKYLSFVMWQEAGDEDNYALWGYSRTAANATSKLFTSYDATNWSEMEEVVMGLRVSANFDIYDFDNYKIQTAPATEKVMTATITGGTHDGTVYNNTTGEITISYPDLLVGFVMDASGSMGWNDRFGTRIEFARQLIEHFKSYYPSEVLFDIIKFGSIIVDTQQIISEMGKALTINVDLNNPDRSTYLFNVSSASVTAGAIYAHNDCIYTVSASANNSQQIEMIGTCPPLDSGTLTKSSGDGDNTIVFISKVDVSVEDSNFIAYGLKNLENGHTYNLGELQVDNANISSASLNNWNLFYSTIYEHPSISLGTNGPKNAVSVDILATETLNARKLFRADPITSISLIEPIDKGENIAVLENVVGLTEESQIDITDGVHADTLRNVQSIDENIITFSPSSTYDIWEKSRRNSIVQLTSNQYSISFSENTTAMILLRDVASTRTVTFYLQTQEGYFLEWDITPNAKWNIYNLYWLDETAIFPLILKDIYGNPFPDGTKIRLSVDQKPSIESANEIASTQIKQTAGAGAYKIYVDSLENFEREMSIDIVDNSNNIQSEIIFELGEDSNGYYIELYDPLLFEFNPNNGAKIIENIEPNTEGKGLVPFSLSIIDTTPIYRNKALDPSLLAPYDPTPVSPSESYDNLNLDSERIRKGSIDIPSIDGYSVARLLPITEDFVKTIDEKKEESERLFRLGVKDNYSSQTEQNTGDLNNAAAIVSSTTTATTTVPAGDTSIGGDYVIQTPVYTKNGVARSNMTTSATSFELEAFEGITVPSLGSIDEIFTKKYTIYPYITIENSFSHQTALQFLKDFEIFFTPRISIFSSISGLKKVPFWQTQLSLDCKYFLGYTRTDIDGAFASSEDGFSITYTVTDRFALLKNGTLDIKIYSNRLQDQQSLVDSDWVKTTQRVNVKYSPVSTLENNVITTTTPLSDIDTWRKAVTENTNTERIAESSLADETISPSSATTYTQSTQDEAVNIFYKNASQWVMANEFDSTVYQQTINIVNGEATVVIPRSLIESVLFVEASYTFGANNKFESIRGDIVFVANPVRVSYIQPLHITPTEGTKYEIETNIIWMDGSEGTIEDNTTVEFGSDNISPAVSVTDNGWARGSFIGPHSPIILDPSTEDCPPRGEEQSIQVKVFHSSGYTATVNRIVEWLGEVEESENASLVHTTGSGTAWADGSSGSISTIVSDLLNDSYNCWGGEPFWVDDDGCRRLQGLGQPLGLPRKVVAYPVFPSTQRWENGKVIFTSHGLNKNIGVPSPLCGSSFNPTPWSQEVSLQTSYFNNDGKNVFLEGATGWSISEEGKFIFYRPRLNFEEPLGITTSVESLDGKFIRDGNDSPLVVSTVTWKGQHLKKTVKINEGLTTETTINYLLPTVTFVAGECGTTNSDDADCPQSLDNRNLITGCLSVKNNLNVSLTTYAVDVSLSRTDIYVDSSSTHTHVCTVDDSGNGTTTSTILLHGAFADHTHVITNYQSDTVLAHSHGLRSVAITQLNPMTDTNITVTINGYVIYDPTGAEPYGDELPKEEGNRMMFSTLYLSPTSGSEPIPTGPKLKIDIFKAPHAWDNQESKRFYTAILPTNTDRGFDIRAHAYIGEYLVEDYEGHFVTIPARDVDDGTRIFFNVVTYKPIANDSTSDIFVCSQTETRNYLVLSVKASVKFEGLYAEKTVQFPIASNLQWLPGITPLVSEVTDDTIYINNALSQIDYSGASPLHDAVKMSAQRIIEFQTFNPDLKDYKKAIFLLTDGDENTSNYSIDQSIDNISFIDGVKKTLTYPIKLGYSFMSDELLLQRYANMTDGEVFYSIDLSDAQIATLIETFIASGKFTTNQGTYTNTISFVETNIPSKISLDNVVLPVGSIVYYQYRSSLNGIDWTDWSEWSSYDAISNILENMDNLEGYMEFKVKIYGNQYFDTPAIKQGITVTYYAPQTFSIFFQPIDIEVTEDQYLSSIHITHEADIPSTSKIYYGVTQTDSTDIADYYSVVRPLIEADKNSIILTRYNEQLITNDYRVYSSLNGGWEKSSSVDIYCINATNPDGILINPESYSANHIDGKITFKAIQNKNDYFIINIGFNPEFRVLCQIKNYGSKAAILQYISLIYNIMKRVPRSVDGNIIHKPLNQRTT